MKNAFVSLSFVLLMIACNNVEQKPITNNAAERVASTKELSDSALQKQLEQIAIKDQTLRFLLPDAIERFGRDSEEYKYIWSLIHRQDSICMDKLVGILDTHGWVGKSSVGEDANQAIWLVMQHATLEMQQKYLPLLKTSVAKGESEGWHLAFLEDRMLMYQEKKQKYGTQAIWDNELKQTKIYPIENFKNVNARRHELGLESIEEYAETNGHLLDQKE